MQLFGANLKAELENMLRKDVANFDFSDIPEWFTEPLPWFYREGGDNWRYDDLGQGGGGIRNKAESYDKDGVSAPGGVDDGAAPAAPRSEAEAQSRRQWRDWLQNRGSDSDDDGDGALPSRDGPQVSGVSVRDQHDEEWRQQLRTRNKSGFES